MSLVSTMKLFLMLLNLLTICANGDTGNMPVNMETLSRDNDRQAMADTLHNVYYPNMYTMYPQEWSRARTAPETETKFNNALPVASDEKIRSTSKFAPHTYMNSLAYKPNYVPWSENVYPGPDLLAPLEGDFIKPKFGLLEPSLKPNKLGSLLNFGFALLGGSGFKENLINNIVRPLLASKGVLKSFIGKLSIPIVALILVNVEILFVVWWLWEDCLEPTVENLTPLSSQASNFSSKQAPQQPSLVQNN